MTNGQAAGAGEWRYDTVMQRIVKDGSGEYIPILRFRRHAWMALAILNAQERIIAELRAEVESLSISYEALDVDNLDWQIRAEAAEAELATMRERAALATMYAEAIKRIDEGDRTRGQSRFLYEYDALTQGGEG